jgi:hypothetical protein
MIFYLVSIIEDYDRDRKLSLHTTLEGAENQVHDLIEQHYVKMNYHSIFTDATIDWTWEALIDRVYYNEDDGISILIRELLVVD